MCHMIVGGVGFPAGSGVGGSRSPRNGLIRVGLHERGHFSKVGLGLGSVRSFRITGMFCLALFFPDSTIVLEGIV